MGRSQGDSLSNSVHAAPPTACQFNVTQRCSLSTRRYTPVTRDPRLTSSHVPQTPTTVAQSAPGSAVPGPRPRPFTVGTTKPGGSPAKPKLGLLDPVPSLADAGSHHGTFAKKEGSSASAHRGTDAAVPSEDAATPRMSLFNAPRSSFAQVWAPGSRRVSGARRDTLLLRL